MPDLPKYSSGSWQFVSIQNVICGVFLVAFFSSCPPKKKWLDGSPEKLCTNSLYLKNIQPKNPESVGCCRFFLLPHLSGREQKGAEEESGQGRTQCGW